MPDAFWLKLTLILFVTVALVILGKGSKKATCRTKAFKHCYFVTLQHTSACIQKLHCRVLMRAKS